MTDEFAGAYRFLASDAASDITGIVLNVDGSSGSMGSSVMPVYWGPTDVFTTNPAPCDGPPTQRS